LPPVGDENLGHVKSIKPGSLKNKKALRERYGQVEMNAPAHVLLLCADAFNIPNRTSACYVALLGILRSEWGLIRFNAMK
jgi:hypothetical protein